MAPLRCAAKFDPFLSLDCAPTPSTVAQSKERKGSSFVIWQHWTGTRKQATLQNLIPSFPWIAPPHPPPWRNPRKGRDQILPSGKLAHAHVNQSVSLLLCLPFFIRQPPSDFKNIFEKEANLGSNLISQHFRGKQANARASEGKRPTRPVAPAECFVTSI